MENRKTSPKYSSEVRERAVRMVFNHAGDYPTQGRLKWSSQHSEVIWWRGPWRSMEAVEFATLEWVDWFNNRRLLSSIGHVPPAEAEAAYYASLEELKIAA